MMNLDQCHHQIVQVEANNRSSSSSQNAPPPPPPPLVPPPPPPPVSGPELFQSIYLQYYDMYMQQATGLSSSQPSTTNSM